MAFPESSLILPPPVEDLRVNSVSYAAGVASEWNLEPEWILRGIVSTFCGSATLPKAAAVEREAGVVTDQRLRDCAGLDKDTDVATGGRAC